MLKKSEDGSITVDVEQVKPGDYITPEALEAVSGLDHGSPRFAFLLLRLQQQIEADFAALERPVMVKGEGYGLRVLTASEAVSYGDRQFWTYIDRAGRTHSRTVAAVRTGEGVEADLLEKHHRQSSLRSRMVQAQKQFIEEASKDFLPEGAYEDE